MLAPCIHVLTVEAGVLGHDLAELLHDLELGLSGLDRLLELLEVHALALVLGRGSAALEGAFLARLLLGAVVNALLVRSSGLLEMSRRQPGLDLPQRRLLVGFEVTLDVDRAILALLELPRDEALVVEGREVGRGERRVVDGEAPATSGHCIGMEWKKLRDSR